LRLQFHAIKPITIIMRSEMDPTQAKVVRSFLICDRSFASSPVAVAIPVDEAALGVLELVVDGRCNSLENVGRGGKGCGKGIGIGNEW
jgi:hypothetical protein